MGNFAVAPAAGYLVLGFGISNAYMILGAISLVCIVLISLLLRKEPSEMGLQPYGVSKDGATEYLKNQRGQEGEIGMDWELSQALRIRSFWLLAGVGFIFGISHYITTTNIVPYATDMQVPAATAPLLLSIIGASNIAGVIMMSLVIERIGAQRTLILCMGFQALAAFWLTWAGSLTHFVVGTLIFGPSYGGMVLCLLVITPEFFGLKNLGLIFFIHLIGGAAGPELGNLIYDFTDPHSYGMAFFLTGCAAVLAVILGLIMKKPKLRSLHRNMR
jgi:OFA family oxalate/formate antiporter-like MFS transporter